MKSKNWIRYWEKCIRDSNRMNTAIRDNLIIPIQDVSQGKVSAETHKKLYQTAQPQHQETAQDDELKPLSIAICPLYAIQNNTHYKKSKIIALVWIPATIEPDGTLSIDGDNLPWIPRDILEPAEKPDFTIGIQEDVEEFLINQPFTGNDWPSLWQYAVEMICYITKTKQPSAELVIEGYTLPASNYREAYVILSDDSSGYSYHLMPIYNFLNQQNQLPLLLQQYTTSSSPEILDELSIDQNFEMALQHLGQPHGRFPLSPSQRSAMHHFLSMNDTGILAVNGPPGTGKTTLLQSVIVTRWVKSALMKDEPPVIFASSSNNQAVRNVISSFNDIGIYFSDEDKRWLPSVADDESAYIRSYGLYCRSKSQKEDLPASWQVIDNKSSDFFLPIEEASYIEKAVPHFLYECEKNFGKTFTSLQQAQNTIHEQLKNTVQDLHLFLRSHSEIEKITTKYEEHGGIEAYYLSIQKQYKKYDKAQQKINLVESAWTIHVEQRSFAQKTMAIVPNIKQQIEKDNEEFCQRYRLSNVDAYDDNTIIYFIQKKQRNISKKLKSINNLIAKLQKQVSKYQKSHNAINAIEEYYQLSTNVDYVTQADMIIRFRCFVIATHYWEASWLIEMYDQIGDLYDNEKWRLQDAIDLPTRWKRYAKLIPCFVSTLYMMPAFFNPWSSDPLTEFIDLLIIDEAGQVTPETAAPAFSLAKQAFVVGDRKQIEPISQLNKAVDFANAELEGLVDNVTVDEFFASDMRHLSVSNGSVMGIAQLASSYQVGTSQRGVFLSEHRRCLPEIIGYCNELAYEGQLVTLTDTLQKQADNNILDLEEFPLPPMGYAHIAGHYMRLNGSKPHNPIEAHVITQWIVENQKEIIKRYKGTPLQDIVGVVTPFAHQAYLIEKELEQHGIKGITVGTVHRLQGAERPVIIFSPVYSEFGRYWFDDGVNMLNVAVSRAKHAFLVFGNMRIFEHRPYNQDRSRLPSTILAKYLFRSEANELTDIPIPQRNLGKRQNVTHITTLRGHREVLSEAFSLAKNHLRIVSPYLSIVALEADDIITKVASARASGIDVTVYTDHQLNQTDQNRYKQTMMEGKEALERAGAVVKLVRRVHSKIICIDRRILIEGSFNWLSAVRNTSSNYQRRESSFRYEGAQVGKFVETTIQDIENLVHSNIAN